MPPPQDGSERRRSPRIDVDIPALVEFVDPDAAEQPPEARGGLEPTAQFELHRAIITTISGGGATVKMAHMTPHRFFRFVQDSKSKTVRLRCHYPGGERSGRLPGRIAWSTFHPTPESVCLLGVEFEELDPEVGRRLRAYLSSRETPPSG